MENNITLLKKDETISNSQKQLLELIGQYPHKTDKELSKIVGYKYYNYISTVKNTILKEKGYLKGPNFLIDLNKITNNNIYRLITIIMFNKEISYNYLISILKKIESWSFFYPLEEGTFNEIIFSTYFSCDNYNSYLRIMEYLKENSIIFHYKIYKLNNQFVNYNPKYYLNYPDIETPYLSKKLILTNQPLKSQKNKTDKKYKLSLIDTRLIMYLQINMYNGELSKIMKHEAKIKDKNNDYPYIFGYNAWRYSFEKLVNNNIIHKYYSVYPLPQKKCSHFFLFINGYTNENTKLLATNIGAHSRTLRSGSLLYSLNKEDEKNKLYWCVHIRCHPLYKDRIMGILDNPIINNKIRYNVKSIYKHDNINCKAPIMNFYNEQSISLEEKYFDVKTQTLNYDYDEYFNNIKESIEKEKKLDI